MISKEEKENFIIQQINREISSTDWKAIFLLKESNAVIDFATNLYFQSIDFHLFLKKLVKYALTITKPNKKEDLFLCRAAELEIALFQFQPIQFLFQYLLLNFFENIIL